MPSTEPKDTTPFYVDALLAALKAQAMRSSIADGTYCWCTGPVDDIATHEHDPECRQARAAVAAAEGNVS